MVLNLQHSDIDWQYYAEISDKASKGIPKGTFWPRGKVLGGSGAINAMLYLRGNPQDYNTWLDMGNPGWGWDDVLEYFKKSEDNTLDHLFDISPGYHGKDGLLKVGKYWSMDEDIKLVMQDSVAEIGHKDIWEFNGNEYIGWATVGGTIYNGERNSPASAFLVPVKKRPNLHVIKNAFVTSLEFDSKNKNEVTGVNFEIEGKQLKAIAKKETIVSAGAVNTPQLLMLSGIGPKAHLNNYEIPVRADLSVGQNLQDHVIVPYYLSVYRTIPKVYTQQEVVNNLYSYFMHRLGPVAGLGSTDYVGFFNTRNSSALYPDVEIHNFYYRKGIPHFIQYLTHAGYNKEIVDSLLAKFEEGNILVFYVVLLKQEAPGKIELGSTNPKDHPKIHANYLEGENDIDTMRRGIRELQKLIDCKSFKIAEAEEIRINIPECDTLEYNSDSYWECYIRYMSTTLYHPVGTAKMGPDSDSNAVVDPELKVKQIKRLRVIDASIMPEIPSANTNAASIMVGEKGADLIKALWNPKKEQMKKEEL